MLIRQLLYALYLGVRVLGLYINVMSTSIRTDNNSGGTAIGTDAKELWVFARVILCYFRTKSLF